MAMDAEHQLSAEVQMAEGLVDVEPRNRQRATRPSSTSSNLGWLAFLVWPGMKEFWGMRFWSQGTWSGDASLEIIKSLIL